MQANVQHAMDNSKDQKLRIARMAMVKLDHQSYYVQTAIINFDKVNVSYINYDLLDEGNDSDHWNHGQIMVSDLEQFTAEHFEINTFYGDSNVGTYLDENLFDVVKAYLDAGKEVSL